MRSVFGQDGGWVSPERDVRANQDVDSALSRIFGCGTSDHTRTVPKMLREQEDVCVFRTVFGRGPK